MINNEQENTTEKYYQEQPNQQLTMNKEEKALWLIWQTIAVFFASIALAAISAVVFAFTISPEMPIEINLALVSLFFQDAAMFFLPVLIVVKYYHQSIHILGFKSITINRVLRIGLIAGVVIYLLNVAVAAVIELLFPGKIEESQGSINLFDTAEANWQIALLIIAVCLLAPIVEETFFRGFVYPPLKQKLGRIAGIIITAAFFAVAHFSVWTFLPLFVGGLGFAWLYDKYNNIWINILAHMLWNSIVVILYYTIN